MSRVEFEVSPTPEGGEEEVPLIFIDLDEAFLQRGAPDGGAVDLLESFIKEVLAFYGSLKYFVFLAYNLDFGDYIRSEDFKDYKEEFDLEEAAKRYAAEKGADLVVWLNGGCEGALALIWWKGDDDEQL